LEHVQDLKERFQLREDMKSEDHFDDVISLRLTAKRGMEHTRWDLLQVGFCLYKWTGFSKGTNVGNFIVRYGF
jgi:hypothetical protein